MVLYSLTVILRISVMSHYLSTAIHSTATCIDNVFELVTDKNKGRVVLGGLQPNQSYLVTANSQWQLDKNQGSDEHYVVKQVGM